MRIRIAVPDAHVTPAVLNAALEATTRANEAMISSGEAPLISEEIRRGNVKWKPEPFRDGEHFDLAHELPKRGWGDCDDLAPAMAAELRATGRDPGAEAIVRRSGPKRWHAIVRTSDGHILDPSVAAGMLEYKKKHSVVGEGPDGIIGVRGAVLPTMADYAAMAVKPYRGKYAARCDLPIRGTPVSLCGVAVHDDPSTALTRAVDGVLLVGGASEWVDPYDMARAIAVHGVLCGMPPDELVGELDGHLDHDEIGSIFSSIANIAKKALPMAASFVPIPGASLIAKAATDMIPGGGGGGGGRAAPPPMPMGPPGGGAVPGLAAMAPHPVAPQVAMPSGQHGPIIVKF